jgi:hypothetical protein
MSEITAVLSPQQTVSVSVAESTSILTTSTNLTNPAIVESMDNIGDVDMSTEGKNNGSILVYRTTTNKWTSTRTLDAQNMEGGEF